MFDGGALNAGAQLVDGSVSRQPNDPRESDQKLNRDAADASRRVSTLLAGFGLDAGRHEDLAKRLLAGLSAADAALEHAEQQLEAWLAEVLGPEILAGQPALPIGRAAFLACDGPISWADLFLVRKALPVAFVTAMRAAAPSPTPMPTPGAMAAQALDSWSITDARGAVLSALGGPLAWATSARPLRTASMKLIKPS